MILCDIGNTTFHFLINGKHKKYFLDEKIPVFDDEVYYISVNEKASKKLLKNNPTSKNIEEIINFKTSYKGLGIDRAVACCSYEDIVIVDAGSAITVDIMEKGIMLSGGGALIQNLDKLISAETGMPVYVAEEPLDCVVKGTEKTLQDIEKLRTILINSRKRR